MGEVYEYYTLPSAKAIVYMRFYWQISGILATNGRYIGIADFRDASANQIGYLNYGYTTAGGHQFKWDCYAHGWENSYTITVTANTFYCIEILFDTTNDLFKAWFNGVQQISYSQTGTATVASVRLGSVQNNNYYNTQYMDCVVVSTSAIGVESRSTLVSDQSDNTGLQSYQNTTIKCTFNLADSGHTTETISSVTVYCRAKTDGSTADKFVFIIRSSSTDTESAEIALTTSFAQYSVYFPANPTGGNHTWTWAEVDALELGSRASTLAATKTEQFMDYWIVVDYSTGGTNYDRTASLTVTVAFSTARQATFTRTASETVTLTFSTGREASFNRATSQTLAFSFQTIAGTILNYAWDVALTLQQIFNTIKLRNVPVSTELTITLGFSTSRIAEFFRSVSEALTLSFSTAVETTGSATHSFLVAVGLTMQTLFSKVMVSSGESTLISLTSLGFILAIVALVIGLAAMAKRK